MQFPCHPERSVTESKDLRGGGVRDRDGGVRDKRRQENGRDKRGQANERGAELPATAFVRSRAPSTSLHSAQDDPAAKALGTWRNA